MRFQDRGVRFDLRGSAKTIAARLDTEFSPEERKSWEVGSPKDWANESVAATITTRSDEVIHGRFGLG